LTLLALYRVRIGCPKATESNGVVSAVAPAVSPALSMKRRENVIRSSGRENNARKAY
jgi:hypothetical protein